MADSVGAIKLDIDLQEGLDKHIKETSEMIGNRLSDQIEGTIKRRFSGIKNLFSFKMPKRSFEMPKKSINTNAIQGDNTRLSQTLENLNAKIDIQREKLSRLKEE